MRDFFTAFLLCTLVSVPAGAQYRPPPPPYVPPPVYKPPIISPAPATHVPQGPAMYGPTLALRVPALLKGATTDPVTLDAKMVTFELSRNSHLSLPAGSVVAAPSGLATITMAIDLNDVPDGGIYVVELGSKDERLRFRTVARDSHRPSKVDIVLRPGDFKVTRTEEGASTFTLPRALKKGRYAVAVTNNQYSWPFEVR